MMTRSAKAAFYFFATPLMRINAAIYRLTRAPSQGRLCVHLGPGQNNYIPGWLNIDANMFTGKCDLWMDFRGRLPFKDSTVDAFYSHHVIEHLPDLQSHFADVFRCLKPGGVYRVGGPSGDGAIDRFINNDLEWFSKFPDHRDTCGGRLDNFIQCRGEHLHILTHGFLVELFTSAGFTVSEKLLPARETRNNQLFADCLAKEWETDYSVPHTIIVEAEKPSEK